MEENILNDWANQSKRASDDLRFIFREAFKMAKVKPIKLKYPNNQAYCCKIGIYGMPYHDQVNLIAWYKKDKEVYSIDAYGFSEDKIEDKHLTIIYLAGLLRSRSLSERKHMHHKLFEIQD